MIPENRVSDNAVHAPFTDVVRGAVEYLYDYERGGVALNDGSQGLNVQLWEMRVVDKRVVQVSSPTTPWTTLFTYHVDLFEASLAFDSNMAPFISLVEDASGLARFWWFDPVDSTQKFTDLPVGTRSPRCCIDDHRDMENGNNDIVLSYIRGGSLYVRYQRERYLTEHLMQAGLGPLARIIDVGMNRGLRFQWWLRDSNPVAGAAVFVSPFLGDVVKDLCLRAGLPNRSINVSELYDDHVQGMKVTSTDGFASDIDRLRDMFHFDKSARDKIIAWPKRGREPVAWIPYSDLLESRDEPLKQTLVDEQKLPREIHIEHIDPDGGYAKNKQVARRRSNMVKAEKSENIDSALVLTADQAVSVTMQKLKVRWNEQVDYEFTTSIKYTFVVPSDVVMVEDAKGVWHRVRIEERNEDDGEIDWEAKQDAGARAYGTKRLGNSLPPPTPTSPGVIGETRFEILNIPVQRGQDDELGLYLAACGESSGWAGYQLLFSSDEGASYTEAFQSENASIIGDTLTTLLEEPAGYLYPSDQTVEVLVNFPLSSVSYNQLLQRKNLCVIGDEVLQFQTATLLEQVGSKYRYLLSGLRRGRFYTPAETWPQGTRFVLLDASVIFAPIDRVYLGADLWYKPVSLGRSSDETTPTAYLFAEALSQTEFPVSRVEAVRDGGDNVTVNFVGAARLGVDTAPYHSKYFRGYRVKFSNGHVIDTMAQSATYNSAPAGVTVQVCALNEITGEGPYSAPLAT